MANRNEWFMKKAKKEAECLSIAAGAPDPHYAIPHFTTWGGFHGRGFQSYGNLNNGQRRSLRRYLRAHSHRRGNHKITELDITTRLKFDRAWDQSNQAAYWRVTWIDKYRSEVKETS